MLMMLVTLSSLFFVRSIKRSSLSRLRAYVLAGPWAAYAQLFGILILPAQWLSLFLFPIDRKARFRLTVCIALVTLLSLPAIILAILGEHGQVSWIPATRAIIVLRTFAQFAGLLWGDLSSIVGRFLFSLYLLAIGFAILEAADRERPVVGFLFLSLVVPIAIALVVSIFKPLFVFRYLLICVPFFVLLASIGLSRLNPRSVMIVVTALIVGLSLFEDHIFYQEGPNQDWRGAVDFVAAKAKPGDVLLVFPEWNVNPVRYYVGRLSEPADFRVITDRLHTLDAGSSTDQSAALQRFLAARGIDSHKRVWALTDAAHPDEPALHELETGHQVTAGPPFAGLLMALID